MRFLKFTIENFKGIQKAIVDFKNVPNASIFTLVGLNESGKTTILEAINSFSPDEQGVGTLYRDVMREIRPQDLVPKNKKANFTGNISVTATVEISQSDKLKLADYCRKELNLEIDLGRLEDIFEIKRSHFFKNSERTHTNVLWSTALFLKKKRQQKYQRQSAGTEVSQILKFLGTLLPTICYFPTFLFGLPERIYLSNPPTNTQYKVNSYYVQIVQDILDSLPGDPMSIKTHILDRVERAEKGEIPWTLGWFRRSDEKQQIDAVMRLIANQITSVVFTRWNEVFGVKVQDKTIVVDWDVEVDENSEEIPPKKSVFLKFSIRDGAEQYDISERSLGFRWFFCFLLFTQFRVARKGSSAFFLFDEPASNLHSRAQEQLLKSFPNISTGDNLIIYSTHSHYMIEPRWLEGAYIVFNDAVDYDDDPASETKRALVATNVHVQRYKDFVDKNPSKMSYFQPILDRLDYAPSLLEKGTYTILVEGKNDFYTLEYFRFVVFNNKPPLTFMPSVGANNLGSLISLYLGWGRKFLIILDDDKAGRLARDLYKTDWLLEDGISNTLADINPKFAKMKTENLLSKDALSIIEAEMKVSKANKKNIARFFQEKCARAEIVNFDKETLDNMRTLFDDLAKKFGVT